MELVKPFVPGLSISNEVIKDNEEKIEKIEEKTNNNKKDKRDNTNGGRKKKMKV
jgi:hypothetical protein